MLSAPTHPPGRGVEGGEGAQWTARTTHPHQAARRRDSPMRGPTRLLASWRAERSTRGRSRNALHPTLERCEGRLLCSVTLMPNSAVTYAGKTTVSLNWPCCGGG